MLLKVMRIKDPEAIKAVRKPCSEISGEPTHGAAPHHVITVGSGGPDHPYNMIQTTGNEHIDCHSGKYSKDYLFGIIAEREGVTVEFIKSEINRMRRGNNAN
jgi:hypothetical protein